MTYGLSVSGSKPATKPASARETAQVAPHAGEASQEVQRDPAACSQPGDDQGDVVLAAAGHPQAVQQRVR
ncbi:hypothetical protein TNCT1_37440 [Streptomyces sp. 1-11]|nr:hypothetical protein TNCT1_37440 [Streptomyces sp. 1-11]